MEISTAYLPGDVFAPSDSVVPRVFISPQRYIQGPGVLRGVGRYLSLMRARRVALLISERGKSHEGKLLVDGLRAAGVDCLVRVFHGECSVEEIESHVAALASEKVDCVIAAGGGKCVDAGKGVAFRLGTPVVIVPSLASNDAPCSALSVVYTPQGVSLGVEFYPNSPAIVVVDTEIIAAAPERYLVAGMGDAMATWYEARVCLSNPAGRNTVGARPTLASAAIGEVCAQTLFDQGRAAAAAVAQRKVDDALEAVVEANTLLSGLGFESGGLAVAHGVAQSFTVLPKVLANHLHGEMVAMGLLAQLVIESRPDEARRVATFFASVGLPVHLGQLSIDPNDERALDAVSHATTEVPFVANMPMPVSKDMVRSALREADHLGTNVASDTGDTAHRRLHRH